MVIGNSPIRHRVDEGHTYIYIYKKKTIEQIYLLLSAGDVMEKLIREMLPFFLMSAYMIQYLLTVTIT